MQYFTGSKPGLEGRVKTGVSKLDGDYEWIVCIVEILTFLSKEEINLKDNISFNTREPARITIGFNKIRYVLYSLAKNIANYSFDKNTFSNEEVSDLHSKIDTIIFILSKIELGQEIIYDDIRSQISKEFESLKTLPVFGKKTFYQLVFGKIASFTGDKIADEIFKILNRKL